MLSASYYDRLRSVAVFNLIVIVAITMDFLSVFDELRGGFALLFGISLSNTVGVIGAFKVVTGPLPEDTVDPATYFNRQRSFDIDRLVVDVLVAPWTFCASSINRLVSNVFATWVLCFPHSVQPEPLR